MLLPALQTGESLLPPLADQSIVRLVIATALGLFLGLEREWSEKSAGVRTFALTSLFGGLAALLALETDLGEALLVVGGLLVLVQGVLLAVQGLRGESSGSLSLTTSVSLLVAYGIGALVAAGFVLEGVAVGVVSALLLVEKRELHDFAGALNREELQSAAEFAILAFVVYPVLPREASFFGIAIEPRVAWLMVVTVAGIGIVNYAIVQTYGGRGIAVTGFFGGLASSTAVVGTMLDHVRQSPAALSYGVAGVLLADAAMAVRNLVIVLAFTLRAGILMDAVVPLGVLCLGGIGIAALTADWRQSVDMDLESPFSLKNALVFGLTFLVILVVGTIAQNQFGTAGLYVSSFLSGLVSSAGATTTAVLLYRGGTVSGSTAVIAVLLASAASVVVKAGLALTGPREFARRVAVWSAAMVVGAGAVTAAAAFFV